MSSQPTLKRCHSDCDLMTSSYYSRRVSCTSESSAEIIHDLTDSECSDDKHEVFGVLEQKVDRLNDLFLEQCRLLTEIKEELRESKAMVDKSEFAQNKFLNELLKKTITESSTKIKELESPAEAYSRSRSLLAAIETKQGFSVERELREALADLLQSDELKERMVSATTSLLGELIRGSVSHELPRLYLPLLQRQRRLPRQLASTVAHSFAQLETHSAQLANSICRVTRSLRRALDRHQSLLETSSDGSSILRCIVEETLQKEMQEWRQLALEAIFPHFPPVDDESVGCEWAERGATPPPPLEYPGSPPQPARPDSSIIDQLMKTAEINKQIQDGDVNSAFERALSAADFPVNT